MKNILVAQIHAIGTLARGVMLETLQAVIDDNPESNIYYLTCSNTFNVCYINTAKKPEVCYLCKQGVKKGIKLIEGKFIHLEIDDIIEENDRKEAKDFIKKNPIISKEVRYKDYEVGEAAVSSYISKSRDKNLIDIKNSFANDLAKNDVILFSALERLFKEKSFAKVYNWNGRNSYQRAVLNISRKNKVDCYNLEIARPGGYLDTFKNVLPHNIDAKVKLIENSWSSTEHDLSEKIKIGSSFFKKKVQGVKTNDKVYTSEQKKDELPANIDYSRKTFVIFTSSDDEFASVGKDFENPFFKDQNEGISFVSNLFADKFKKWNLIIRMHPNLKGVQYDYVRELRDMDQIADNVTVIPPESPVDSYALLNSADRIIVFGSTIGLEANYWGKPVILLGKCFWFYQDIAYVPKNRNEIEYLLQKDLKSKSNNDAIKFGYYFLKGGEQAQYFQNDVVAGATFKDQKLFSVSRKEQIFVKLIQKANDYLNLRLLVK